jgi:TRAP-type mannitol/chloroaromatic compound transport system substrate-binding protein
VSFAETVYTLSGGELAIEVFASGVLFPVFDTFDAASNGVIEMHMLFGLYWPGKDPHFNLLSRPGCPITTFMEAAYLEEQLLEWQNRLYNPHGQTYLGPFTVSTVFEQLMSTVPIRTIEDLQGLRIRSSGFGARFFNALGATAVSLPLPELYPAFQTGAIDAGEWTSWEDNMRLGFHEVVSYVVDPSLHCGIIEYMALVVNTAAWEALPQRIQNIIQVAREQAIYRSSLVYIDEIRAKRRWAELPNIEIITWSDEDMRRARETGLTLLREEAEQTELGMEFLTIYRNTLWDLGHTEEALVLGFQP